MKRIVFVLTGIFVLTVSCGKQDTVPVSKSVFARIADEMTRTFTDETYKVFWNADDHINVFYRYTYGFEYAFTGEDGALGGKFDPLPNSDFVTGNAIDNVYAVYPYNAESGIRNDESYLTVYLPSSQSWREKSFGPGANTMVAASADDNLYFMNVGGYLVIKLYGSGVSVKSVSLKGNAGELLAGKAQVAMPVGGTPATTIVESTASDEIVLTMEDAVSLGATADAATECWFVVPPLTFAGGFTVTVTSHDGNTFTKATANSFEIVRSTVRRMAPVEVAFE